MKKMVVLISGGGSNLQTLLDLCASGAVDAEISAVISNRPGVTGLQRAVKAGSDAITLDHTQFNSRADFDQALLLKIDQYQPDFVILAGFMRILTDEFVNHYIGKMINIHPSLLPKYPGLNTHQRAIDAGDAETGATVHFVTPELDGGPLIAQSKVPVLENDDSLTLSKRVLAAEHQLYPTVVKWLCEERLTFAEGLPCFEGEALQFPRVLNDT